MAEVAIPSGRAADKDLPAGYVDESTDRPLTPREEKLEAIARGRRATVNDEIVEAGGNPIDFDADAAPAAAATPPAAPKPAVIPKPKPAPAPQAAATAAAPAAGGEEGDDAINAADVDNQIGLAAGDDDTLEVVVDGERMKLPRATVVANYQKSATADKRLREANVLLENARRSAPPAAPAAADPATPASAPVPKVDPKAFSSALFEGDEDKAAEAFNGAVAARVAEVLEERGIKAGDPVPAAVDTKEITARVRQELSEESALAEARARYPKLFDKGDIETLGSVKIQRRMAEGVSFTDALTEVSGQMAESFGWEPVEESRTPAPAPKPNHDRGGVLERKRGIDKVPAAAVRRDPSAAEEATPPMDESVRAERGIAQLRAARERGRPTT